ncbi:MAG TPA: PKD domain-containing protein [Candidatus Thermoplasmatota archaeon]|nr:PKD domain-containing protein [Candidatus Thermoplasmatota archaeon]
MRSCWALLLALLLIPTASAAVRIDDAVLPERTMAGKPFPVNLTLTNDGREPRTVWLFAALYERQEGAGPCGPAVGGRFKTFTHLLQENVRIPAGATIAYPDGDDRWLHLYRSEHVAPAPALAEFCVFVANASQGQMLQYESFRSFELPVRGVNAKPTASFTWSPERPGATQDVAFRAEGSDADGDPVTFSWDFGHLNASGRARAVGSSPTTFFYPPGDFVVTLTASDGLEETQVARTIAVGEAPARQTPARGPFDVPLPALVALAALALAARARRR